MKYIIYQDGVRVNCIVADEAFCQQYYSGDGYSYEAAPPEPEPEPAPVSTPPTADQILDVLLGEVSEDG